MKRCFLFVVFFMVLFPCLHAGKQNPLVGIYWGRVNCATCNGLRSKVILSADGTAKVQLVSADGLDDDMSAQRGDWVMKRNIIVVVTGRDSLFYRRLTNRKIMKIHHAKDRPSKFINDYVLIKESNKR